jgi:uncharacterized protein (DUF58 family)
VTRAGWLFLAVSVLIGLAAVKSQRPLMFVVFGGMMGAMHISAIMAKRMLSAVAVRHQAPSRVWQNQTVHIGYFLRNVRPRASCLGLGLEQLAPEGVESASGYCAHLAPRGRFRAGARFAARRRGRFRLRGVRLNTSFPFGLVEAHRRFEEEGSLVVWPARGRLRRQLLHRGAVESSSSAPSRVTGGQDEFFGLRDYREGDNPRWIHWRRSAGRAKPVVREMSRPLPEILWLVLDTHGSDLRNLGEYRRERMLRFAATVIDYAFSRGYQVGLALGHSGGVRVLAPAGGRGQRRDLLDALADVALDSPHTLTDTLSHLRRSQLRQAQVVLLAARRSSVKETPLLPVRLACRHLRVINEDDLEGFFDDDPLAVPEGEDAD